MRYTLKDYQEDSVGDVLRHLADARFDWKQRQRTVAFSLTATTGAGKTVMAAAVIEALFDGSADHDFEADPGAVILWFTDDPSLNEQTRFRILDASDRIAHSRLVVIEHPFALKKLEPRTVYFLNTQKLGKNSLLVKQPSGDDSEGRLFGHSTAPDTRPFTFWETLSNTITDEKLTLYLILDEAHRGMKVPSTRDRAERATIVRRLVNGDNGVPPVPIVWGISATVERFNAAMKEAEGRTNYPDVVVDPAQVQESGLLKDDIRLEFPAEKGQFDTVLLARATRKLRDITGLWRAYRDLGDEKDSVVPLMVVQVPNKPSDDLLLSAFTTIKETWPEVEPDAMAHVFGEHTLIELGGFVVPHVSPENVQERTHIRVLFAKDAISTGWDCPRAEVLVSFRPAKDETHITQMLGRMIRTPLARRIPGNDRLNSVECLLPRFNVATARSVVHTLMGSDGNNTDGRGGTGGGEGRRVLIEPVDMRVNTDIPEAVWEAFDRLPSQTLPRKSARPTRRLTVLAQALSRDGLRPDALKEAYGELIAVLNGFAARHTEKVEAAVRDITEVSGETIVVGVSDKEVSQTGSFTELADERSVEAEFKGAGRVLGKELVRRYADHIADEDEDDDGLFDAHVRVAALGRIEGVGEALDEEADKLAEKWFGEYRVSLKGLSDDRRTLYNEIRGMSPDPQPIDLSRPRVRTEETKDLEGNKLETRPLHLMSDDDGSFPVGSLNKWEVDVLDAEMARKGFMAWYRNPSRPSEDALAVAYKTGSGAWRRMFPDFLFLHEVGGEVRVSIVDPHSPDWADALPKLRGWVDFADAYASSFHRIESIARLSDGALRVLDLTNDRVREEIRAASDAKQLYISNAAHAYE